MEFKSTPLVRDPDPLISPSSIYCGVHAEKEYEPWAEGEHARAACVTQKLEQSTWRRAPRPVPCAQEYICFYLVTVWCKIE